MRDINSNLKQSLLTAPVTKTATFNSTSVATVGYESLALDLIAGASGDTLSGSVYFTGKLQESDDNSSFTDVSDDDVHQDANLITIDDGAEDESINTLSYKGIKPYVRMAVTFTGTHSNGTPLSVVSIQGNAGILPVA